MSETPQKTPLDRKQTLPVWLTSVVEILLLVLLFYLFAPGGIPGTNEPHYLCKAKAFWDAGFCQGDVFLESADAHYLFYFTLGALTQFLTLTQSAIAGRLICWMAIAFGWSLLCYTIFRGRFWSLLAAGIFLLGLHYCHFAGEWLIGGVEAKCIAYAFLFAGLSCVVRQSWAPAWILLGFSAAFHVLVGGWGIVAAFFSWLCCRGWKQDLKWQLVSLVGGFLVSLLGLVPALSLTLGADGEIVRQANEIYTFERLPHHLVFSHIVEVSPLRLDLFLIQALVWGCFCWVGWENRSFRVLNSFVLGTLLIASCALWIEWFAVQTRQHDLAASLLRYYWFRLSDVLVPLSLGIGWTLISIRLIRNRHAVGALLVSLLSCLVAAHVTWLFLDHSISKRSQADQLTLVSFEESHEINRKMIRDWIDVCVWIRTHTPGNARFITPRRQSTFKWYANRSEVVAWKDVPQDAMGIVDWRSRFETVFGPDTYRFGLATLDAEERLMQLGEQFGATHLVIERRHVRERKADLENRYRYRNYVTGLPVGKTPFSKPLCLKQVYPDRDCSEEIRRDSAYLVYRLEIPPAYRAQLAELNNMLLWYERWDEWYRQQIAEQEN